MTFNFLKDLAIEFISGAIAGVTMIASSHPFEYLILNDYISCSTIKMRMIMNPNLTMFGTIKQTFLKEGLFSFYKGMLMPLCVGFPVSAVIFMSYETYMKMMKVQNRRDFIPQHWLLGGAFAGVSQAFIACPAELLKQLLQGPFQLALHILKNNPAGMYKGMLATLIRDIPQYAIYLFTFEYYKQLILKGRDGDLTPIHSLAAGLIGGITSLVVSYPQEMIKAKIQCEVLTPNNQRQYVSRSYDGGIQMCARSIYSNGGLLGFTQGFNSCVTYYMISCAVQIAVYDQLKNVLTRKLRNFE